MVQFKGRRDRNLSLQNGSAVGAKTDSLCCSFCLETIVKLEWYVERKSLRFHRLSEQVELTLGVADTADVDTEQVEFDTLERRNRHNEDLRVD